MQLHYNTEYNTVTTGRGSYSLNKAANSPYWMVSFRLPGGKACRRSTKVPHAGGMYLGQKLSAAQAKKRALLVAAKLAADTAAEEQSKDNRSVREIFDLMLTGKLGRVSPHAYTNARTSYDVFLKFLGKRADEPIHSITKADLKAFIIERRKDVRHATCRQNLVFIRAAFAWAQDAEIIDRNPCDRLTIPADSRDEKIVHEAFTLDEIKHLLEKLPSDWANAMRCCLGTYGQRLGDVLNLKWEQFDFTSRTVSILTGKTARPLSQPMQEWFYNWASAEHTRAHATGGDAATWVNPELRKLSCPSRYFTALVRAHGIGLVGASTPGRRRVWHSKTFHSLRASVATMLQAAGVSQGMAMQLVGHDSQDVHSVYIRPSSDQLREAANALPSL